MPRFHLSSDPYSDDASDEFDALYDDGRDSRRRTHRRVRPADDPGRPALVAEGRSGRASVDVDLTTDPATSDSPYSSYDVATHGPQPPPRWLVTALSARDRTLGGVKSGKEADVTLLERAVPDGASCLLAVKTYRGAEHRLFHRDAGYLEGRSVRRSRETRAMAKRTSFGRELLAGQWATAEFGALCSLWCSGVRVPYPVQIIGAEIMMQFIAGPDGAAAPRLIAVDASTAEFTDLFRDLVATLEILAGDGKTHGDLSPYNVLVDDDGCVLIDLPQVVDLIGNPQGPAYLQRDCQNIATFFARRGVAGADGDALAAHLWQTANPSS